MLQEVIAAAEGAGGAAEEKNEMEELKQLLPDIREKVEDAKESQRTASTASQAIQQTLVSTQHDQEQCTLLSETSQGLNVGVHFWFARLSLKKTKKQKKKSTLEVFI